MPSFAFQFTGSNSAQLKESLTSWYSLRSGIYGQLVIAPVIFFFFNASWDSLLSGQAKIEISLL